MITDAIINVAYVALGGLHGLLPDAPERSGFLDGMVWVSRSVNYLLPVTEILGFMGVVGAVYGGFVVWRLVRFLWIGGG